MKKGTAPLHIDRKGCHLTLDNVPAWICSQCGEAYFEENEVNAVQRVISAIEMNAEPLLATG
jgi:YgiT-type zinc finger domain-containing protein